MSTTTTYTAFHGFNSISSGTLEKVLPEVLEHGPEGVLIFEDETGKQRDFDFRGAVADVLARATVPAITPRTGPGRPKLGVVSREISLLPRHWQWLEQQPQGASAAIRRLVEDARQRDGGAAELRQRIEATGRVMTALAGNLPGFEEAMRSLYAHRFEDLSARIAGWPQDIRNYLQQRLAVVSGMA